MTNVFKQGGPYEISIGSFGSTLADMPIKFLSQFGATFSTVDWALGALLGGFLLWGTIQYFTGKTPLGLAKGVPFVGKFIKR